MFGISELKEKVADLELKFKQLECEHLHSSIIFTNGRTVSSWVLYSAIPAQKECKRCGKILKHYYSSIDLEKDKAEWHEKEAKTHLSRNGQKLTGYVVRSVSDGDYIKKIKGRWVHERSGSVLKVRK